MAFCGQFSVILILQRYRDIYSGHPPPGGEGIFVQIEKQGEFERKNLEGKRGEKKKYEKSDKTHVKIPL